MRLTILVLALLVSGCVSVSEMSDYACLDSPRHTYAKVEGVPHGYQCRRAVGQCEVGFIQADNTAAQCEANPHCEYLTGSCYCPPGMQCICGGGSPGQCQFRGQTIDGST